jgi:hypothetical protein
MSSFFAPPPPPPEPPERPAQPPRRPWHGPPNRVIGRTVALNLVLGQSDKAVIWIPSVTAYPYLFEFEVEIRHQLDDEGFWDLFGLHYQRRRSRSADGELDPEVLRLGIQLSDGRKATNLNPGYPFPDPNDPNTPPAGPILGGGGGGGGGDAGWNYRYWVWPLPPAGPFAFVCEWPFAEIPETRTEIDSALLRDAAADAITVWAENESDASQGDRSTTGHAHRVVLTPAPSKPPEAAEPDEAS